MIKATLTIVVLLILAIPTSAQWSIQETVALAWHVSTAEGEETFEGAVISDEQLPTYNYRINIPTKGELSASISQISYELTNLEVANSLGTNWKVAAKVTQQGKSHFANVSIVPLRKGKEGTEKLTQFTLELSLKPDLTGTGRGPMFKSESTFANGTFYKIGISEPGVYSISGQELADNLAIDIASLDPSKIKIYTGNAGRLPEPLSETFIDDMVETPISIVGGGDGNISETDEVIFYADGPDTWTLSENSYNHIKNVYAENTYVYLRTDGPAGKRINTSTSIAAAEYISDDYDFLQIYDEDKVNLLGAYSQTEGTGQVWYGDYFGSTVEMDYTGEFDFSGHVPSKPIEVKMDMAARSKSITRSIFTLGDETYQTNYLSTSTGNIESAYARASILSEELTSGQINKIQLRFEKASSVDEAWLNYIQVVNRRAVSNYGDQTIIQDRNSVESATAGFRGNIAGSEIWNITDPTEIHKVPQVGQGWNYETKGKFQKFIAVKSYRKPSEYIGLVENQNLHAIQDVDMVILHPSQFAEQAEELAEHRRKYSGLIVETVDVEKIYNEFSSGKLDVTAIRNFAKMIHDRSENFKYLLLLGDGSYDYRGINPNLANHNFVPVYETRTSLDPILGFPSDDFFGLLSDDEGGDLFGDLDISVGRIPVETTTQAQDVVRKIINYDVSPDRFGDWRLKLGFAADDEDGNTHLSQSDQIARSVENENPIYNQQKVYFDAFEQVPTPGGDRFYDASNTINSNVQKGQLVLNYLGHGGPTGWAQERVLKVSDIDTWTNMDHLPVLVTATCSFTGFDDPNIVTAGEYALRKSNGGCIALMTTVRAVYSSANKALADVVFDNIFRIEDGDALSLGEILTQAKNSVSSSNIINSRKFALIGDPSMKIAIPTQQIATTKINGRAVAEGEMHDTIRALETVTIEGVVTDTDGTIISDFNGTIYPTIYDKKSSIETLGSDDESPKTKFEAYRNILFKGAATVTNGVWAFDFVVPKDINYKFGEGRISYYADNGRDLDAAGYYNDVIIGGSSENIVTDDLGPSIELYMDNTDFKEGGAVQSNSTLLVFLNDDLGINVSGTSIGHDLTATLDGEKQYVLNDFYESSVDDFTSGMVRFPLNDLNIGLHTITVKAWDIANNSATSTITFEVVEGIDGEISNVLLYPNPTQSNFSIRFDHNLSDKQVEVDLLVYNSIGQYISLISKSVFLSGGTAELAYDQELEKFSELPEGVYYYKIKLNSIELNSNIESTFEKFMKVD